MKQFRRMRDFVTPTPRTIDGSVGSVQELHVDDQSWTVRYLLISTGVWLMRPHVVIAPVAVAGIDDTTASMRINLRKEQIEQAKPVSRQ